MSVLKSTYRCAQCAFILPKWQGSCPQCHEWNCIELVQASPTASLTRHKTAPVELKTLAQISATPKPRFLSNFNEWDRVLGGGIVPGSLIILTGDPGIGKSTLLLQIAQQLSNQHRVVYFSTEESAEQIKLRAIRLTKQPDQKLFFSDIGCLETIVSTIEKYQPDIAILDSIQNCYSSEQPQSSGSVSQIREAAHLLMRVAKEKNIAIIITAHVTKEGHIAGPKTLEHVVDAVFYLQNEDSWQTRILRSVKNRFGPVNEIGFFEMGAHGLVEVPDINQKLLAELSLLPGSVLISTIEGSRPLILELQALTIPTKFGLPQRIITGVDHKRVILIAAILEKYLHVKLSQQDIFFKVSGGFKLSDSSVDLGIALALLSSYFQKALSEKSIALGELSLTGQIKPIGQINAYLSDTERFGIQNFFVAQNQKLNLRGPHTVTHMSSVYELLNLFKAQG